jgi:hypothetical protein
MTIKEAYEEYKNLDHLLLDKQWLDNSPFSAIMHDLWGAVQEEALRSGAAFNREGGGREITNPVAVEVVPTPEQGAV